MTGRHQILRALVAFCALAAEVASASAQTTTPQMIPPRVAPRDSIVTRAGVCRVWELAPVNAIYPDDASYNACALDTKPRVITRTAMPYTTTPGQWMHAQFIVVIEPDGHVNNELTRFHIDDSPPGFLEAIRDSLFRWKFSPGVRQGKAVRSALKINLTTIDQGEGDPHKLDWRYRDTEPEDTLTATWVLDKSRGELNEIQSQKVYAAMLKELGKQRVLIPREFQPQKYCLIASGPDSINLARLNYVALQALSVSTPRYDVGGYKSLEFAPPGCERDAAVKRIFLPQLMPTITGAVVLNPSGDFLPNYPAGFDGRSWPSWQAHCVGQVVDTLVPVMRCSVEPGSKNADYYAWSAVNAQENWHRRQYRSGSDSVHITAVVTTENAYQLDTLRSSIAAVPLLRMRAITDSIVSCGGAVASTGADSTELYVVYGNPDATALQITRVVKMSMRQSPRPQLCDPRQGRANKFVAFLIGGMGTRVATPSSRAFFEPTFSPIAPPRVATEAVSLAMGNRSTPFILDPARHTIASQPALQFGMSDLRSDTRVGGNLKMRVTAPAAAGRNVTLLMVISGAGPGAGYETTQWVRPIAPGMWDVNGPGQIAFNAYVYLYLIER